jgi:hypothetical protein
MIGSFSDVLLTAISLFFAPHFGLVTPFTVIGEGGEHVRRLACDVLRLAQLRHLLPRFRHNHYGGAPRRRLNSIDFGGFQRFSTRATRDWNGSIIAGFL